MRQNHAAAHVALFVHKISACRLDAYTLQGVLDILTITNLFMSISTPSPQFEDAFAEYIHLVNINK